MENRKKNDFSAISINKIVAERYRTFSKKVSKSHTLTLELMMDFFEQSKISPTNKYFVDFVSHEAVLHKRMDYLEELLRSWERNSTFPELHNTLKQFFELGEQEAQREREELELDKKIFEEQLRSNRATAYDNHMLKREWAAERKKILRVLDQLEFHRPRFGKSYYKLEIESEKLEALREILGKEV